ncbi:MAG: bifunctional oligoribonuclease/PAP phosphatase NrnA, partial [Deltaproteobacteria bacterium]|nr:bifunctional oligoribonuclease/PAP phosphatase NrnA [Deltaproteobacteria bacterium]
MSIFDEAIEVAKNGKRFIVITHVNPEGDALGSMLGLTLALRDAGKEVFAFTEEGAPEPYGFLPGMDTAVHTLKDIDNIDATFATDCGQLSRLGEEYENFEGKGTIVNL